MICKHACPLRDRDRAEKCKISQRAHETQKVLDDVWSQGSAYGTIALWFRYRATC